MNKISQLNKLCEGLCKSNPSCRGVYVDSIKSLTKDLSESEFDQLSELSKKTLSSYVSKAGPDLAKKAIQHGKASSELNYDTADRLSGKVDRRQRGITKASHKLAYPNAYKRDTSK